MNEYDLSDTVTETVAGALFSFRNLLSSKMALSNDRPSDWFIDPLIAVSVLYLIHFFIYPFIHSSIFVHYVLMLMLQLMQVVAGGAASETSLQLGDRILAVCSIITQFYNLITCTAG